MNRNELAKTIRKVSSISGSFRLRSGVHSDEYFDKYLFESDPEILGSIARHMLGLLPASCELLAGLELGGSSDCDNDVLLIWHTRHFCPQKSKGIRDMQDG